ncbi:hypothetical protein H6P81_016327 [Aristolochia fimbriata]|uniref:Uncharacterized protein n=1 Tax=Aristolochia fimbriata TaxID=158543 RepID=A0AAV7EBS5_ARIFI|nr:hypothetical protein H6P81_016327 [Aristolochia fimbriata]
MGQYSSLFRCPSPQTTLISQQTHDRKEPPGCELAGQFRGAIKMFIRSTEDWDYWVRQFWAVHSQGITETGAQGRLHDILRKQIVERDLASSAAPPSAEPSSTKPCFLPNAEPFSSANCI